MLLKLRRHHDPHPAAAMITTALFSSSIYPLLLLLVLSFSSLFSSSAYKICDSDDQCSRGSVCFNGTCSNPFAKGCLVTMKERLLLTQEESSNLTTLPPRKMPEFTEFKMRSCSSFDKKIGGSRGDESNCLETVFPYEEIRISPGNWRRSVLVTWIYEILLSEIFGVPVSIEMGNGKKAEQIGSFYDTEARFVLSENVYPAHHLMEADRVHGICSLTDKPCSHLLPDVWYVSGRQDIEIGQAEGSILQQESNGMVVDMGYYIPQYTAMTNSSLATFYGLRGEENRQALARIFLEPTSWVDFCDIVDPSNCTVPMEGIHEGIIARRYPQTNEEKASYFIPGLYTGHFRVTERTNCTTNPQCSGHLIGPQCSWTTYADNQMYWNNITLSLHGPGKPNNGYSYEQMMQIWRAANATRSHVFMWWVPDLQNEEFHGTDYAFQRVTLPTSTQECLTYRVEKLINQKCSASIEERRGEPIGACDYAPVLPKKVMSRGLKTVSFANKDESMRSPAYQMLRQLYLPEYSSKEIFRKWASLQSDDTLDAPREAVCEWVFDHLDELMRFSPENYPRSLESKSYFPLAVVGYILGSIAMCVSIMAAALTFYWRGHQVIKTAQFNTLSYMVVGHVIVSLSALLHAVIETSNVVCTLQQWTLRIGYTLEIVPILIKVSAINKLGREARRFRRAEIDPNRSRKFLSIVLFLLVTYLIVWTTVDMPKRENNLSLEKDDNVTTVCVYAGCASSSPIWKIMVLVWETLLLLSSTVLAYQSRDIIQQLNESHWLAFLVYAHTVFLLMRLVINVLLFSNMIQSSMSTKAIAVILSLDTIIAIVVYFCPKFCLILRNKKGTRAMQVEINHIDGPLRRQRRSFITGVNIPLGGVPNLIRRDVEQEQIGSHDEDIGLSAKQLHACLDLKLSSDERKSSGIYVGDDENDHEDGIAEMNLNTSSEQSIHPIHDHNFTNNDDCISSASPRVHFMECSPLFRNTDI